MEGTLGGGETKDGHNTTGGLLQDEVTIIKGALDFNNKNARDVMTPHTEVNTPVYSLPDDTPLDETTMAEIMAVGHSRVLVHAAGSPEHMVGLLLVKRLIALDPEDAR